MDWNRTRDSSHPPREYNKPLFFNGLAYVDDVRDVNDACSFACSLRF